MLLQAEHSRGTFARLLAHARGHLRRANNRSERAGHGVQIAMRYDATGLAIERWTLGPIGALSTNAVAAPRGARPAARAASVSSASPLVPEFAAFDPQLATCASGASRILGY